MNTVQPTSKNEIPSWVNECISLPHQGVLSFLKELCKLGNAPYAYLRIKSKSGKFDYLVESIGPYKKIGWQRRFDFMGKIGNNTPPYQLLDYKNSKYHENLKNKFNIESPEYKYLESLSYGCWFPLKCKDIELGYTCFVSEPVRQIRVKS